MRISTRFYFTAVLAVALVIAISLELRTSSQRFKAAAAKREAVVEWLQQINSLSHLTNNYLLQASPSVREQWLGVASNLTEALSQHPFTLPERVAVVEEIRERVERMGTLFSDLSAVAEAVRATSVPTDELRRNKFQTIGSFLNITMHESTADIMYLLDILGEDVTLAEARASSMVLTLVLTAGLVVCVVVITLHRSLVGPLATLQKGVATVASGNLAYRTGSRARDEIGDLARSFDGMLDELQKRTAELSAANAELRVHREHLEQLVEERTREVRRISEHLADAQAMARLGSWEWDAVHDVITGSKEFYRLFGASPELLANYAAFNALLDPNDREHVQREVEKALTENALYQTEYRVLQPDGSCRQIQARGTITVDDLGHPAAMTGTCLDITELKQAEAKLHKTNEDLERSNKELEQFAYVASHDLQEPLRMVASYTQLLAQRYEGQLDEKAKKYIDYAVDGAVRMQRLINDLLAYSRIGTRGKALEPTDTHAVLGETLRDLAAAIEESRAMVTNDDLPIVRADASQLALVFQNLIGNAIKFRSQENPRVHVAVADQAGEWVFSVRDNGIGIDPKYADRIFVIFQRLHTREEYPGTGIGLAVCKRVIERHGGRIWFESEPGKGSTFFFSIPK